MSNTEKIATLLVKIYPLEIQKFAPRHYKKDDEMGRPVWNNDGLVQLVDQHLRLIDLDTDDLKEIAEEVATEMFNEYFL